MAFLQALGLVAYCGVVASLMWHAQKAFKTVPEYFAPLLFLTVFTTSALICGILALYQPFLLWEQRQTRRALKLVLYTALWLVAMVILLVAALLSM